MQTPNTKAPTNWRVKDFCAAHGIGRTKFYQLVSDGELRPVKFGKSTLIPDTEVQAFQQRLLSGEYGCP